MYNKKSKKALKRIINMFLISVLLISFVPFSLAQTETLQEYFGLGYDLDVYINSDPRYLDRDISWNDPELTMVDYGPSYVQTRFEDWTDNSFDDVVLKISADNEKVIVERISAHTAARDRTYVKLDFSSSKEVRVEETGQTFSGKNLVVDLWDDNRYDNDYSKRTIMISEGSEIVDDTVDLAVTKVEISNLNPVVGEKFYLYPTITNYGNKGVNFKIGEELQKLDGTTISGNDPKSHYIGAGETKKLTSDLEVQTPGQYTYVFRIYCDEDENEGNNKNSISFSVDEAQEELPDLTIDHISAYTSIDEWKKKAVFVDVYMENKGEGHAGPFELAIYKNDELATTGYYQGLGPGGTLVYRAKYYDFKDGKNTFRAVVDYLDSVEESNEGNNAFSRGLIISQEQKKPDLMISNMKLIPSSPKAGESFKVEVTVYNAGPASASTFAVGLYEVLDVTYTANDVTKNLPDAMFQQSISLGAYESKTFVKGPYVFDKGTHTLMAEADIYDVVDESNENNNRLYKTMYFNGEEEDVIYVKLGEIFKLEPGMKAVVTDYDDMSIKLKEISQIYCVALEGVDCGDQLTAFLEIKKDGKTKWINLENGKNAEVFGAELWMLWLDDDVAKMQVQLDEDDYTDLVRVQISPKQRTIDPGDDAKYKVTIKDKHHPSSSKLYTYDLYVKGMPYDYDFVESVTLKPQGVEHLELEIETETYDDDDVKFRIVAVLRGNSKVQASDYATLRFKSEGDEEPVDANFILELEQGWNLVSLPGRLEKFTKLEGSKKVLGFVWLRDEKEYVTLSEAQDILGNEFDDYLSENAFWIYSYEDQKLWVKVDTSNLDALSVVKGWNLLPLRYEFVGKDLNEIKNGCSLSSTYYWDAKEQEWTNFKMSYEFKSSDIGKGFIAKSAAYCNFEDLTPPEFPEVPPDFPDETTDTDNDGILDKTDNCPYDHNPEQEDVDQDGSGNACDPLKCVDPIYEDYVMTEDLVDCPTNAIEIMADNIEFDCNGHLIEGKPYGAGIWTGGKDDLIIKDCKIKGFDKGIRVETGSDHITFHSNTIEDTDWGIWINSNAENNTFYNNTIKNSEYGIYSHSGQNLFYDNVLTDNDKNAYETATNDWNLDSQGNEWDDFSSNVGYPDYYEIDGPGEGVDSCPNDVCNTILTKKTKVEPIVFD